MSTGHKRAPIDSPDPMFFICRGAQANKCVAAFHALTCFSIESNRRNCRERPLDMWKPNGDTGFLSKQANNPLMFSTSRAELPFEDATDEDMTLTNRPFTFYENAPSQRRLSSDPFETSPFVNEPRVRPSGGFSGYNGGGRSMLFDHPNNQTWGLRLEPGDSKG